jgi:curli biogenesis system outer membrane secretion channel CsgG
MKFRNLLMVLFLAAIVLSACNSSSTAQTPPPSASQPGQSYPAPQAQPTVQTNQTYPAPQAQATPISAPTPTQMGTDGSMLYPDLASGSTIMLNQAESIIMSGQVKTIILDASGKVTITLKQGRSFVVIGVSKGAVQKVLDSCGDKCKGLEFKTP